jgi:hypothetical protein
MPDLVQLQGHVRAKYEAFTALFMGYGGVERAYRVPMAQQAFQPGQTPQKTKSASVYPVIGAGVICGLV